MAKLDNKKGQSMFELMMAVFITAITLVALLSLVGSGVNNSTFSRDRAEAVRFTNEVSEWLRAERDTDWNTLIARASSSGRSYCLQTLSWPTVSGNCASGAVIAGTKYTRQITLVYNSTADPNTVEARIVTTWEDSSGTHESRTSVELTNWRNI